MRRLLAVLLLLPLALAQVFPQGGGRYAYSDGTLQELLPTPEGYRLRYLREGQVLREDRLRLSPEGLYLLGLGLPEGYFPFAPPLLLYPLRLFPGQAWGGSAQFRGQRVALSARVEGLEGLKTKAGAFQRLPGAGGLHHGKGRHRPQGALPGAGPGGGGLPGGVGPGGTPPLHRALRR